MPNINFLRKITFRNCPEENLKFTRWLMKLGLLASSKKCPSCYHGMRLKPPYGEKEAAWLCRDICHGGKSISRSIRCGSIFQGSHVKLSIWMHFIFRFAQGLHLRQIDMLQEGITGSSASLTKLAHVLRKVCKAAVQRMRRRGKQIVGRRGEIVLIDESKFGHKRKYNRGRTSSRNSWVFGILGIKEQRRRPILKIVPHRSTDHLIPQIKRHVRHGSSIVSDGWRAYRCLRNEGYSHTTVNHKENFVDPQTGAHTQNIERRSHFILAPTN